ncbi:MAG: cytidylate kinase-like family protein [Deltaproteobacteria bacterium]|nr:cytidylate kinase-like family protein [Deltaproteobacteria bacterium]
MPVIIISSDLYQTGREVAESVASVLGYDFLGREILEKVAVKYMVSETELARALDDRPSFLRRSRGIRSRYLAYIQEATLSELLKGNTVCQGLAAHLYVLGVSHVLRVRILSDFDKRADKYAAERGISLNKAQKLLDRERNDQRRWSVDAFQLDETDPSHYDLVIGLSQIDLDEAVKIITETAGYPRFKPMTYSINCMEDLALSSGVKAALLDRFPNIRVYADRGTLVIETFGLKRQKEKKVRAIKDLAREIPGVEYVEVHVMNPIFHQASASFH